MSLLLHRSHRAETLAELLCGVLSARWPDDPFERVPIVVGSRGMERYLRHEIATRTGIAAGLAFPFPRPAFAGATRWLIDGAVEARAEFWELGEQPHKAAARFEREAMAFALVEQLRQHMAEPGFEHVRRYLEHGAPQAVEHGPVTARELMFARDVADVLDRLMHDRPDDALTWARAPEKANSEHRWLAVLLQGLDVAQDAASPVRGFEALRASTLAPTQRTLCVFGLSTLGPGDRARLGAIARSVDVHLFVLAPTRQWFVDQRTRDERRHAVRAAKNAGQLELLELETRQDNPIVAALGAPSRDLQSWLEETGYAADDDAFELPLAGNAPPSLLERVQAWMLEAQGLSHVHERWPHDSSMQFHATYGALRQCEVLRDELLGLFAQDPTLEPRDVLVMTPDIETYAPLLAAVFARRGDGVSDGRPVTLPEIATSIADLGLCRTNPMAEVMLALLELAAERVTATRIATLLSLAPVRNRFGIGDDELGPLHELIQKSGLRWGLDAADRAQVDQPARDQNTVRFAAERLALGVLMPDEDALGVVLGNDPSLGPAVPLDARGTLAVEQAGELLALLRALRVHRAKLAGPWSVPQWREHLLQALDAVAQPSAATAWLRAEVVSALDQLVLHAAALGELPVQRDALAKWLTGGFELPQRGDRPITGAVTVCALQPMRSVPFRVVVLVGMDDNAFPRGGRAKTWDPFEQRRPGERDGREIDRHLLLEALLSARDKLIFLWSGHEVQTGKEQAAAVPVEELLETLSALTGSKRTQLVREHPLQPWSEKSFLPTPTSHDAGLAAAAAQRRGLRAGTQSAAAAGILGCRSRLLPEEANPPSALRVEEIVNALYKPQRHFLRERLGLWLETKQTELEDREPLELDALRGDGKLTERVLDGLRALPGGGAAREVVSRLQARLAGQGELPLHAGGSRLLEGHEGTARAIMNNADAVLGSPRAPLTLAWRSARGFQLSGQVQDVREHDGNLLLQWQNAYGDRGNYALLDAWLHVLLAHATQQPVVGARIVGASDTGKTLRAVGSFLALCEPDASPASAASVASAILEDLVRVYERSRRTALRLFRLASPAAASELLQAEHGNRAIGARVKLQGAVSRAWHGNDFGATGDREDPWVATLFDDYEPADDLGDQADGFLDLARRVWLPVRRAQHAGEAVAKLWKPVATAADGGDAEEAG